MAAPLRKQDEDDERKLSATERARLSWGMQQDPTADGEVNDLETDDDRPAIERAGDRWGDAAVHDGDGDSDNESDDLAPSLGDREENAAGDDTPKTQEDDLKNELRSALKDDELEDTGFYKGKGGSGKASRASNFVGRVRKNRWAVAGLGGGIAALLIGTFSLLSFLNVFKLEHLMDSIDSKSFARVNATFENRSDKWMRAYISVRMMEYRGTVDPTQENLFFKAERVDTNRPLTDWYRNLRTSNFEKDLFEKSGIQFVSAIQPDGNGGITFAPGTIKVNGDSLNIDIENQYDADFKSKLKAGDLTSINNLGADMSRVIDKELFADNKQARRAIKKAVNDNTYFFNVIKRRTVRKGIQNKIGVTEWKFFETKRNNITAKKSEIQKKLLRKLLPDDTRSGKFLLCVFGVGTCVKNSDVVNPENKSGAVARGSGTASEGDQTQINEDGTAVEGEDGNPIKGETGTLDGAGDVVEESIDGVEKKLTEGAAEEVAGDLLRAELLNAILSKLNIVTSAISVVKTMDILSRIDNNLTNGKLTEIAVAAKSAQAAAAFTTYVTARDQVRSGQLTTEEFNVLMETLTGAENSEAYDTFFNKGVNPANTQDKKDAFCNDKHVPKKTDYYWNCDSTKIGGDTNGTKIEDTYMNSVGRILHPLSNNYREVRNKPGIKQAFDFVNWISGKVDELVGVLVDPIIAALGLDDKIQDALAWLTGKITTFIGAGPILSGVNDASGLTLTMIGQGGAYTGEMTMRNAGAPISNAITKAKLDQMTLAYQEEKQDNLSFTERYLALDKPDSLAARGTYSLATVTPSKFGSIGKLFGSFGSNLSSIFSKRGFAASNDSPASFAGLDEFAFPQECTDREVLDFRSPLDYTNAETLLNAEGKPFIDAGEINMDLLGNSAAFWAKAYERVGDNDTDPKTIMQLYNCETLEQQTRGGLAYVLSGYNKDGGLEPGSSGGPATGGPVDCSNAVGNAKIVCAGESLLGVRYANRNAGTGDKWLREWGVDVINGSLGQRPQEWIETRVVGGDNDFMECSGYVRTAIYVAFNVTVKPGCSGQYMNYPDEFMEIDKSQLKPGDLLVENNTCCNGGHIGIFTGITDTGKMATLESSAGTNTNGEKKTGYYERNFDEYRYAVRYVGPGGTP